MLETEREDNMQRRGFLKRIGAGAAAMTLPGAGRAGAAGAPAERPNIVWVCAEDMSANMSCYGETTIRTPTVDRLAREGARFTRAFITCPVCSPSRSAMVTGMYQTTIGAHNHRSSRDEIKIRLPEHIRLISEYFQDAGYYTCNGRIWDGDEFDRAAWGKTDYNFVWDDAVYDAPEWSGRREGQPFFAQIQLRGGKYRGARVPNPVDAADVKLPPYYPDHPVLREDWARYLNSVIHVDTELAQIMDRLEDEGIADNTIVFFWTDHGISHIRDKQFLYEGGIHIPLIVRGPGIAPGAVRDDLVEHIDIAAASLQLAGLPVPEHVQGRALFAPDYEPREYAFSARDRCDETVERIRCVRTERFKYIRNFFPERSHTQHNRYKNHKQIMITMRQLYAEGKLTPDEARPFLPTRPIEELYDLESDPHELKNLADSPRHRDTLEQLRAQLDVWMDETGDLGAIPEPALAEMYKTHDSAWEVLQKRENRHVVERLDEVRALGEAGERGLDGLIRAIRHSAPAVRYEAAKALGNLGAEARQARDALTAAIADEAASVRVAAARALCKMGMVGDGLPVLRQELVHKDNEVVRHYAALALEDIGEAARPALDDLKAAKDDSYGLVGRVATRAVAILEGTYSP
ncbi:MAG: sulfatase-like hydrolase/transferase [Armatimonadota bacterium]|jgi:arylsulfatase A-like enzyme